MRKNIVYKRDIGKEKDAGKGDGANEVRLSAGATEPKISVPESVRQYQDSRRRTAQDDGDQPQEPPSVSAGVIERITDYAFNPTREKIREMTTVNRLQAILLPQLDLIGLSWRELIEVAIFRQDSVEYQRVFKRKLPEQVDPIDEYIYRFAQWSKSRDGMNLKSAVDLSLAEIEGKINGEEEGIGGTDAWGKE